MTVGQKEKFTEFVYESLNSKKSCLNIFTDFSKAFDTTNHHILLKKLELYGIRGNALGLLLSYLVNRNQCVRIRNALSTYTDVTIGFPQRSILCVQS